MATLGPREPHVCQGSRKELNDGQLNSTTLKQTVDKDGEIVKPQVRRTNRRGSIPRQCITSACTTVATDVVPPVGGARIEISNLFNVIITF